MRREASVGGILGELFSLLGDSARDLALYTLVIGGIDAAGVLAGLTESADATLNYGFMINSNDSPASALFEFVSSVVSIFGTYLLLARFLAVRGLLRGGRAGFWHDLGTAILSTIGVVLGLFLLFVPGIMLLVRWSAASGFVIGGSESVTGSLSASWEATRGHGWAIFFAALLLLIGITACAGVAAGIVGQASPVAAGIVSAFVEAASGGVLAAFGIAVYCLVNDDAQDISEVFA